MSAPDVWLVEQSADTAALGAIRLAATTRIEQCDGLDVAVVAYEGGWRRAQERAALLIGVSRTVRLIDLNFDRAQSVRSWLGDAVDDPDLGQQALRLLEAIAARYPLAVGEIDARVLAHLRATGGDTATGTANGRRGGVGARRSTIEQALARLVALGVVQSHQAAGARGSVALVFRVAGTKVGRASRGIPGDRS